MTEFRLEKQMHYRPWSTSDGKKKCFHYSALRETRATSCHSSQMSQFVVSRYSGRRPRRVSLLLVLSSVQLAWLARAQLGETSRLARFVSAPSICIWKVWFAFLGLVLAMIWGSPSSQLCSVSTVGAWSELPFIWMGTAYTAGSARQPDRVLDSSRLITPSLFRLA